jgi:hypothetical protein
LLEKARADVNQKPFFDCGGQDCRAISVNFLKMEKTGEENRLYLSGSVSHGGGAGLGSHFAFR